MSIALLVIDMQKEFEVIDRCKVHLEDAVAYINEASGIFRAAGKPVVFIQDEEAGEGPGSEAYEIMDSIDREEGDLYISKFYSNSFWKTKLEEVLADHSVEFVVIAGFAAEHCVLFTYNGALERGFGASILQHGVAGFDLHEIKNLQHLRSVVSLETVDFMLEKIGATNDSVEA